MKETGLAQAGQSGSGALIGYTPAAEKIRAYIYGIRVDSRILGCLTKKPPYWQNNKLANYRNNIFWPGMLYSAHKLIQAQRMKKN